MNIELLSYYIGIFIVFTSHIYMLYTPDSFMTVDKMKYHAYLNLVAVALIAYYFTMTTKTYY